MEKRKSGYVYIMECEGYHKIGYSSHPKRRLKELNCRPFPTRIVYCKWFENALQIEQWLHREWFSWKVKDEWYDFDRIIEAEKGLHINGREFFKDTVTNTPVSIVDYIISVLENIPSEYMED